MQIIKEIYLDFYQTEPVLVTAKQGDNARFVKATLLDHGNLFPVPDGTTANLARDEVWNACIVNTDGTVLAPITPDMRPGRLPAEIELYLGTEKLSTWNFTLMVQPSVRNDSAIEGTNEYTQLDILVNQAREEISNAQTATESANAAALNANESAALANTAASNANVAANSAETNAGLAIRATISALDGKEAATSAATSANVAADRANEAAGSIEQANIKPPAYSVSGESITAGNSAERPLIGLTVHGRADQVSTTGAQLIDFEHAPTRSCVLVDASTGTYRCNMDNTSYSFLDLPESVFGKILSGKGKTLRFQCDTSKPGTVISIVIYGTREDGLDYQDAAGTPGSNYVEMVVSDQFTSVTRAVLRFNQTQGATTTDTTTIYSGLMLYFKESAVLPFEPYTGNAPSPSVEYPQAIDIAGSGRSINVKVVGANLFDISKVQSISGASGSQTTNNNDGTLLVQSSQGDSSGGYEDGKNVLRDLCPELRAGDIAVLSAKSTGSDKRIYLRGSKSPWAFGTSRTISETDLDSIVMFYASGISTSATISEIMINAGNVALPYEPYKTPQSVSLSTPNGLSGLKVSSGGSYTDESGQQWICDEIVRNERGTGKLIQRIGRSKVSDNLLAPVTLSNGNIALSISEISGVSSSNQEALFTMAPVLDAPDPDRFETGNAYSDGTGFVIVGTPDDTLVSLAIKYGNCEFLYVLETPVETNLSAEEIAALSALHTYSPTTTISNDAGCEMTAAYVTKYYQGVGDAMFYGVADNLTTEASGTSVLDAHQGKVLDNKIGALNDLETTAKSSAVAAINEVKSETVSLIPTVLFDSPTRADSGTFTESIYNFERIRIYYKIRCEYGSVDIYTSFISTDGVVDLIGFFDFNNYLGAHLHRINLTDTTFSTVYAYQYFPPSAGKTDVGGDDAKTIYRVEGYRS